jgi:hypothetical protein
VEQVVRRRRAATPAAKTTRPVATPRPARPAATRFRDNTPAPVPRETGLVVAATGLVAVASNRSGLNSRSSTTGWTWLQKSPRAEAAVGLSNYVV